LRIPTRRSSPSGRVFIDLGDDVYAAIMHTVRAGWDLAAQTSAVHPAATEVEITESLRDGMRTALANLPWGKTMIVLQGSESRSNQAILRPDGRTDIPILIIPTYHTTRISDPHAIIECKRLLKGNSKLNREYVNEGLDRFWTGKYSATHHTGFMAGYLMAGTAADAVDAINAYLLKKGRTGEELRVSPLGAGWAWCSEHLRQPPSPAIRIHHALLDVFPRV
jgi:hypothetical protein